MNVTSPNPAGSGLTAIDPETTDDAQQGPGRNALFAAIQSTRMPMILTDPHQHDNPIIFANRAFVELSGYSEDELVGRNCRFLQGEETSPEAVAKIRHAIATQTKIAIDVINYSKDGRRFVNELYISPVFSPIGHLLYFFGSQVDVTAYTEARLSMQLTLVERERFVLSQIAEGIPLGRVLEDLLRSVEARNGGGMRTSILFLSEDGRHLHHGAAPSLPTAFSAAIDGMAIGEGMGSCGTGASRGQPVYVEEIASDPLWVGFRDLALSHGLRACWSTPIMSAGGGVLGTFAIYYDVPRSPTQDEIAAIGFVAQTAALAIERHRNEVSLRRGEVKLREVNDALQAANRRLREVNESLERTVAERTEAVRLFGDIVQFDAAPILAFDRNHRVIAFNQAHAEDFQRVMGLRQQIGDVLPDQFEPEQAIALRGLMDRALAGERFVVVQRFGDPSLEMPSWEITYTPLRDATGRVIGAFHHARDITERVRAESELAATQEALRQSQKMEAVGQLTGGLAHDFNNLLAVVIGSLDLLERRIAQGRGGEISRFVSAAQEAAKRAASLTQRLLAFSRRQTLDPKPTAVNQLIAGMENLIRRTVGPEIKMETVGASGLWNTLVDASQLENALLNLCINARDAMPDGGQLTITTANQRFDDRTASARDMPPGQYIALSVSDTGCGMPPEVIAKAFDPFFTTKPLGQGTGLGLSMIYGFARQSGGQVRIHSDIGHGTKVSIFLPRHQGDEVSDDEPSFATPEPAEQGDTVLVVDDEPGVRMLIVEVLKELGYRILEAADGPSAMKIIGSTARIDLLVTDVGLPGGMNGRQVADAARETRSDLKILFITGYAEVAVLNRGNLNPGMSVLTKPFAVDDLANRIKELISTMT